MIHIPRKIHSSDTKIHNYIRNKLSKMLKKPGLCPTYRIAIKSNDRETNDYLVTRYEIDPNQGSTIDVIFLARIVLLSNEYREYLIKEYKLYNHNSALSEPRDMPDIDITPGNATNDDLWKIYIPEIFCGDVVSAMISSGGIYMLRPTDTLIIQSEIPIPGLIEKDGKYVATFEQIIETYPERHADILNEFPLG